MKLKIILFSLLFSFSLHAADCPFHKGVNITSWIWSYESAEKIPFSNYSKLDLEHIKSLGCDVVRLPISLLYFSSGEPDYTLEPLFFFFLDQVLDWAEELGLYLILDNHTQKSGSSYVPVTKELIPLWTQLAEHYKDRSALILYEIMNEPHNVSNEDWLLAQDSIIAAIRSIDSNHTIIATPVWNALGYFSSLTPYPYLNIIYSFHFYEPFIFTHQGASWTNPPMVSLGGIPFPATNGSIPDCPDELIGTWIEGRLNNYTANGTNSAMYEDIDLALAFADSFSVPVFCGEFGVYRPLAPESDRAYWYSVVTQYFETNNIPWTIWGYQGGYGFFKKDTPELFHKDLDPDMISALGLSMPPQDTVEVYPDTVGFGIFSDFADRHIIPSIWTEEKNYDLYSANYPALGNYSILWQNADQYDNIGFYFGTYRDISYLADQDAFISFMIRGDTPGISMDIRFTDTYEVVDDHPWRMVYQLNDTHVTWDNSWQRVSIPLSHFYEAGSWHDGHWYPAEGKFDWSAVKRFDFTAEQNKLIGTRVFFDDIKIEIPETSAITDTSVIPENFSFDGLYPNPFNVQTILKFSLQTKSHITIYVYDLNGRHVDMIVNEHLHAGSHRIPWSAKNLPSGIYLLYFNTDGKTSWQKALLVK